MSFRQNKSVIIAPFCLGVDIILPTGRTNGKFAPASERTSVKVKIIVSVCLRSLCRWQGIYWIYSYLHFYIHYALSFCPHLLEASYVNAQMVWQALDPDTTDVDRDTLRFQIHVVQGLMAIFKEILP